MAFGTGSRLVTAEPADESDVGLRYDALMGRWSRMMASRFVTWLAPRPQNRWLDVGCGTGALTAAILQHAAPSAVWGIDPDREYVRRARAAIPDSRCRFEVGQAESLPEELHGVDYVTSGLVLNQLADPAAGLGQMVRVTRPGGTISAYVWDFARGMQLARRFWDAAQEFDPVAAALDQARAFPLCHPDRLRQLFVASGLNAVDVRALEIPTVFRDFDDYWVPFETGHGRASDYINTLSPQHRVRLRERLRNVLAARPDGSIALIARAWAIVGQRSD